MERSQEYRSLSAMLEGRSCLSQEPPNTVVDLTQKSLQGTWYHFCNRRVGGVLIPASGLELEVVRFRRFGHHSPPPHCGGRRWASGGFDTHIFYRRRAGHSTHYLLDPHVVVFGRPLAPLSFCALSSVNSMLVWIICRRASDYFHQDRDAERACT